MEITAKMVKDLRETTGAGMMDCKKALVDADGVMDAAVDILRTKGLAALAKKAGRATNEGIIGGYVECGSKVGVMVEVNCETDFVARNADFKSFVTGVASHIASSAPTDVVDLMAKPFADGTATFEQALGAFVSKVGENMGVARFMRYELASEFGLVTVYVHGVGNIGVMVEVAAGTSEAASSDAFALLGRDLAMQIAAVAPYAVSREKIEQSVVDHELSIYKAQAAESGKPEPIQQKIAEGRLEKFFKEVTLLEQDFVKDSDKSVRQYIDAVAKNLGTTIEVVRFDRFVMGETAASGE